MTYRSFDAMTGILAWVLGLARQEFPEFTVQNKRVLEVGTGQFLNHPFGFFLCGALEVVTIDKTRLCVDPSESMQKIVHARRLLSGIVSQDDYYQRLQALENTGYHLGRLADLGIHYRIGDQIVCAPEAYDIVYSYAVLEHVRDPFQMIATDHAVCRPGGYLIYYVDLEDHRYPGEKPFEFLTEETWETENRLRLSTWKDIISRFDIDARYPYAPKNQSAPLPLVHSSIAHTDEDDLRTTAFLMVGKKR